MNKNIFGNIGEQSTVVIQCTHDTKDLVDRTRKTSKDHIVYSASPQATTDPRIVAIDIGDLVFQVGRSKARGTFLNNALPVTSNLNGLKVHSHDKEMKNAIDNAKTKEEKDRLSDAVVSKQVRFIGLALGGTVPNPEREEQKKTQLTVRVQGTGTVFHNGSANIAPGDKLIWELFTEKELKSPDYEKRISRFGRSPEKVMLKVVPMSHAHLNFASAVIDAVLSNGNSTPQTESMTSIVSFAKQMNEFMEAIADIVDPKNGKTTFQANFKKKEAHKMVSKVIKAFLEVQEDISHRQIGRALSFAKPGEQIDVLLGVN